VVFQQWPEPLFASTSYTDGQPQIHPLSAVPAATVIDNSTLLSASKPILPTPRDRHLFGSLRGGICMFEKLSFAEVDRQDAELLPARTVMSVIMSQSASGSSSNGSNQGPSNFAQLCSQNQQNCDALVTAFFNFLFGPPSSQPK
jgi:hypothetical protein